MPKPKDDSLSLKKILDADKMKQLADLIASEEVDRVIVVYRDKKSNRLHYDTSVDDWAVLLGEMVIIEDVMENDRHSQDCLDCADCDEEDD